MLVLGCELPIDCPMTDLRGTFADGLAGGGIPNPHVHVDFPGSGGRASGQ